jgi:hypothetical protein
LSLAQIEGTQVTPHAMHVLDHSTIDQYWSVSYYLVRCPQILLVLPQAPYLVILSTLQFVRGSVLVLYHPFRFRRRLRGAKHIKIEWIMKHMERHA